MAWSHHKGANSYYWTSQNANGETIVRYAGLPVTYGFSISYRY